MTPLQGCCLLGVSAWRRLLFAAGHTAQACGDRTGHVVAPLQGNEDLLKVFLQYIRITCSSNSGQVAVSFLGPELASLLDGSRVVRPEVRHGALAAVYAAMTAAMHGDEVRGSL